MYFFKATMIIFLLHLLLVLAMGVVVAMDYDPTDGLDDICESSIVYWSLFYLIDFPFLLLYSSIAQQLTISYPQVLQWELIPNFPFQEDHLNFYWLAVVKTGCETQIIGWINWTIIWLLFHKFKRKGSTCGILRR